MKKMTILAALGCALIAAPVAAQDTVLNHDGFHIEAIGGYDVLDLEIDGLGSGDEGDIMYGIAAGYDFRSPNSNVTFGVEAELADSSVGIGESYVGNIEGFDVDATASADAGRDIYVGARVGGVLSENVLVYAKGGYTNMSIDFGVNGTIDGEPFGGSENATFDGVRFGAGVEFAFSQSAFAKLEYRYSNYRDGEIELDGETFDLGDLFDDADLTRNQFVAGVGFRF